MSEGIHPVFNPPIPHATSGRLGDALSKQLPLLDELALAHGITCLTTFADSRPVFEEFDGPQEELQRIWGQWQDWFACQDGRAAAEALAHIISSNPAAAEQLKSPDAVVQELRAMAQALAAGEASGARFRLETK